MVASTVEKVKTYTIAEYMQLPNNGKRYELVRGELVEMGQPGDLHGRIGSKLLAYLWTYGEQHALGLAYLPTGFVLDDSNPKKPTVRAPDVAFVSANRIPQEPLDGPLPIVPDLAIEVVSPTDIWTKVDDKVDEYLEAGVRLVWVIYPRRQTVYVYHPERPLAVLINPDSELNGEDVIPGFKPKIGLLFE